MSAKLGGSGAGSRVHSGYHSQGYPCMYCYQTFGPESSIAGMSTSTVGT